MNKLKRFKYAHQSVGAIKLFLVFVMPLSFISTPFSWPIFIAFAVTAIACGFAIDKLQTVFDTYEN